MLGINYVITFAVMVIARNEAARILAVFPTPSISHQVVFRPIVQELLNRGHEVVVVTTDPAFPKGETPANLTEIDVHERSYKIFQKGLMEKATGSKDDLIKQMEHILGIITTILEDQLQNQEFKVVIKLKNSFDLLLIEAWVRPTLALSHIFKVPVIQVSSFGEYGNYEAIGAPSHPFLYPSLLTQKIYNLTLWEKITNLYSYYRYKSLFSSYESSENEMIKRQFGPDTPPLSELKNNVDMLFLNTHPMWEGNHPVPPSVIHLWGLHLKPEKELPKELKSYIDSSTKGVIYMSFGTNTQPSLLSPEKIQMFIKVFSQLPYEILWKWDKEVLPGQSKNIRIGKWFPQPDLLRHPKMKLFITQGGLQSTDEAITAGVPLIGIPMLGDQWYNVEKYRYHRIGVRLDMESLTEDELRSAINTVIEDKSYRRNIVKLGSLMRDQPMRPLDRAVWWIEHVLRHGGARHLRAPAANMSWREYLELDLILALLSVLFTLVAISSYIFYKLYIVYCKPGIKFKTA